MHFNCMTWFSFSTSMTYAIKIVQLKWTYNNNHNNFFFLLFPTSGLFARFFFPYLFAQLWQLCLRNEIVNRPRRCKKDESYGVVSAKSINACSFFCLLYSSGGRIKQINKKKENLCVTDKEIELRIKYIFLVMNQSQASSSNMSGYHECRFTHSLQLDVGLNTVAIHCHNT